MALWSAHRDETHRLLTGVSPTLAALYRKAIDQLDLLPHDEGEARARLSLVGHCFRELMNRLPDALRDVEELPGSKRGDEDRATMGLVDAYEEFKGTSTDQVAAVSPGHTQLEIVSVPRVLVDAIARFVIARHDGTVNVRNRDSAVVLGVIDPNNPSLKPWREARDFFMSLTHISPEDATADLLTPLPSDEETIRHVKAVEASLGVRLGEFFDKFAELEDLIDRANEQVDVEAEDDCAARYRVPSDEEVLAALARLGRLPLRRAFYERLNNPHWVKALARHDVFRHPPETMFMPDGNVRSDPWPEIDYLVRMASIVSADVADSLEPIARESNQWVRRGIAEAAALMEPDDIIRLVPAMKDWIGNEHANFRVDEREIIGAIVRLFDGGHHRAGMQLAQAYLEPRAPEDRRRFGLTTPVAGIESYWYKESLHRVAELLGTSRLPTLARWLKTYQICAESYTGKPGEDKSHIWRTTIRDSAGRSSREIGDALVDELRTALVDSTAKSPGAIERHLRDDQPLLRRIALDVLAEALGCIEGDDENPPVYSDSLARLAQQVLNHESYLNSNYRAEYLPLVRVCLALEPLIDVTPFFEGVRKGPLFLRNDDFERFAEAGEAPELTRARMADWRKRWQHTMLTLVGCSRLTVDLRELLASLDDEYGPIEVRDSVVHFESFTGPNSPLELDSLREMSAHELLEHLRAWHPDPDVHPGPSHEGQGRLLEQIVSENPVLFADQLHELQTLRPTYIRHVVNAWGSAAGKGLPLPMDDAMTLCEWAVSQSGPVKNEGDSFDDDADYGPLRFAVLRLIEAVLASRPHDSEGWGTAESTGRLFRLLLPYASDPQPTPDYEAQYGGDNMDPLTLSLNSLRPVAIRALVLLACRFPEARAAQQALCVVGEHVGNGDPSLAVAAAMGEATGRLYDSQRQWIEEYAGAIHGGDAPLTDWQQVALSTALSVHRVHPGLLTLLRPSFVVTIERMISENLTAGWLTHDRSFPQLIGDWLMTAVISGWLEPDDSLVALWFERTGAELRGEVMDHLGWQLSRSEEVPVAVLTAAAELWDKRAEHVRAHTEDAIELSGVYWFVHSEKYPTEWWLPRLEYASSVIPDYDMHGMVGEQLAAASRSDPGTSVSVLENVFQTRIMGNAHTHYDLMERAVPQVIASALDSGDVELGKRAIGLMNRLGADGYILLKDRVEMLRT